MKSSKESNGCPIIMKIKQNELNYPMHYFAQAEDETCQDLLMTRRKQRVLSTLMKVFVNFFFSYLVEERKFKNQG